MFGYCHFCGLYTQLSPEGLCSFCWNNWRHSSTGQITKCKICNRNGFFNGDYCNYCAYLAYLNQQRHPSNHSNDHQHRHEEYESKSEEAFSTHVQVAILQVDTLITKNKNNSFHTLKNSEKISFLEELIDTIYNKMNLSTKNKNNFHEQNLFIISAPEYFFVASQESHFIHKDEAQVIIECIQKISERYHDLLLIPGTMGWYDTNVKLTDSYHKIINLAAERAKKESEAPELIPDMYKDWLKYKVEQDKELLDKLKDNQSVKLGRNTCYIYFNGDVKFHDKQFESVFDLAEDAPDITNEDYKNLLFVPQVNNEKAYRYKGIKIGIEICSDHNFATLTMSAGKCQIHIIISAYTDLFDQQIAAGYVIHADSKNSGIYSTNSYEHNDQFSGKIIHHNTEDRSNGVFNYKIIYGSFNI